MLSVVAKITTKDDAASCAKFEELFAVGAKRVQTTEPGCLLYQVIGLQSENFPLIAAAATP